MAALKITATEFQKSFGRYREVAAREPVTITNHGRDSLVLVSATEYERLLERDNQMALRPWEISEAMAAALRTAQAPPEAAAFDQDWLDDQADAAA